jgi:hypothetical protein
VPNSSNSTLDTVVTDRENLNKNKHHKSNQQLSKVSRLGASDSTYPTMPSEVHMTMSAMPLPSMSSNCGLLCRAAGYGWAQMYNELQLG